ncbi:PadR family transcriptional regulator [Indiicoccus explosivorum]|uniref:PadR family transcriptional regulator n=1 Tax=Indiicoccus explosivorum TaxID=1917864 RepID=UPI000B446E85|nr:PadR family transcriptional regulator [Indiicoccus explosivorum]
MAKENYTQYALLGLLTTDCRTGYAIKRMIDNSLNHFWKISYGQIYPMLKLLVEKGYATVEDLAQDGKPDKKEYSITPKGEQVLKDWIKQPISDLPVEKNEVLLKLFFGRHQDTVTTLHQLDAYKEKLIQRRETYENIRRMIETQSHDKKDAPFWLLTLDYGLRTTQAAIDWCTAAKKTLS